MHFYQFLSHICFLVQNWKLMKSSWYIYYLILHTSLLMCYVLKISFWRCFCQFIQFLTLWLAISPSRVENWNFSRKAFLLDFIFWTKVYLCVLSKKWLLMHVFLIWSIFCYILCNSKGLKSNTFFGAWTTCAPI